MRAAARRSVGRRAVSHRFLSRQSSVSRAPLASAPLASCTASPHASQSRLRLRLCAPASSPRQPLCELWRTCGSHRSAAGARTGSQAAAAAARTRHDPQRVDANPRPSRNAREAADEQIPAPRSNVMMPSSSRPDPSRAQQSSLSSADTPVSSARLLVIGAMTMRFFSFRRPRVTGCSSGLVENVFTTSILC